MCSQAHLHAVAGALEGVLQPLQIKALNKLPEGLGSIPAMLEISAQHPLDERRSSLGGDACIDLPPDVLPGAISAADENVKTLDQIVAALDARPQQSDVADEVLGTRVSAAGQMNVDGLIEIDAGVEIIGDRQCMPLGVGGGVFAAGVSGAGDHS